MKLIRDMRRRNPNLGMVELWYRLRQRGYTRRPESLFRVMKKLGLFPPKEKKPAYKPKPYQQMTYPGQRIQVDVKVVPRRCIADPELRLYQYTAIDEFTTPAIPGCLPGAVHLFLCGFSEKAVQVYARRGIRVECVQTDNGFEFTNRFSNSKRDFPTLFETTASQLGSATSSSAPILHATTVKWSVVTARIRSASIPAIVFTLWMDFTRQLAVHNRRSNNFPMWPLKLLHSFPVRPSNLFDKPTCFSRSGPKFPGRRAGPRRGPPHNIPLLHRAVIIFAAAIHRHIQGVEVDIFPCGIVLFVTCIYHSVLIKVIS